ncbi:MAG: filamentous hemagglutinin N-terminal domain-containing protein [Verrucomicrobiota bacterium]
MEARKTDVPKDKESGIVALTGIAASLPAQIPSAPRISGAPSATACFERPHILSGFSIALLACGLLPNAQANPLSPTVLQGSASFTTAGPQLSIRTSDRAFINWQSFNIRPGETTTFVQPNSSSLVWNRIQDSNPSQILGNLNANGYVVLQNESGFYIGGQAAITTHGLVLSTAPTPMPDLSSFDPWKFEAPPLAASIINYGQINSAEGGSTFLIAHEVGNHGSISAPGGDIGLFAARQILLSERPDGRGLSAKVTLPQGSVDNSGRITANAGTIAMRAAVVNQGGLLQADSVREKNGVIELVASDAVNLGGSSHISARGGSEGSSPGGTVVVKSEHSYNDHHGSTVDVSGGIQGGAGGAVELSAATISRIETRVDGHSAPGSQGGRLRIDPVDLELTSDFVSTLAPTLSGGLLSIDLEADHDINLSTLWNLTDPGSLAILTLKAGNNLILNNNSGIAAENNWSVSLDAGSFGLPTPPPDGTGGIYLHGNSYIQTRNGDINLHAANEILINSDLSRFPGKNGIRTLAGGSIFATADCGSVNSGSSRLVDGRILTFANVNGFIFGLNAAPYYSVSQNLGGISTAAGGDVEITAGMDVISFAPIQTGDPTDYASAKFDGGSGAFGSLPGNVTISAGRNVYGHYVLARGVGSITAGGDVGVPLLNPDGTTSDPTKAFALSLIDGKWDVSAPQGSIFIQDIRNPNGIFGERTSANNRFAGYHVFDYAATASVVLSAVNGAVELTGQSAPHTPPRGSEPIPLLLPPTVRVFAGSGGFTMNASATLFPSPFGELEIKTTGGGDFSGVRNFVNRTTLSMADGGSPLWTAGDKPVGSGYDNPDVEVNNPNAVNINVSGSIKDIDIVTTKETHVTAHGDIVDVGFRSQNLNARNVSSIHADGRILNTAGLNFVSLPRPIIGANDFRRDDWTAFFTLAVDPSVVDFDTRTDLGARTIDQFITDHRLFISIPNFVYDPGTLRLGFNGDMSGLTPTQLEALTAPVAVVVLDARGYPIVDPQTGRIQTRSYTFIPTTESENPVALLAQVSMGAPIDSRPNSGYVVGGHGRFTIEALSMDLGNTIGVETTGGASLGISLSGDLTMLTSRIATFAGGDLSVVSMDGSMDLGSQNVFIPNPGNAYGIYTSGRSDVSVISHGDLNINGSRIASYNGGNVYVESTHGDVNVGSGGNTYVNVPLASGAYSSAQIYGSGIVAVSLPKGYETIGGGTVPGNITVTTPRGNIASSLAGILQVALDGNVSAGPKVTLSAGTPAVPGGSPAIPGNIILGSSGLIGGSVNVTAQGNIEGLIISRQNSVINAAQNFSGTLLSAGSATVAAAGTVSGTAIGVGGASVSGTINANVLGQNVSVNGGSSQSTLGTSAGATATSQAAAQTASSDTKQQASVDTSKEEDEKKKKGVKRPSLLRRIGRVTVILPKA